MKILRTLFQCSKISQKLKVGDFIKETRIIKQSDIDAFSNVSGDHNPIHKAETSKELKTEPIVHGAFLNAIVSGIIGTKFPGHGTMVLSQSFSFPKKCYPNDPIEIVVEVVDARKIMKIRYEITQEGHLVFEGSANLLVDRNRDYV